MIKTIKCKVFPILEKSKVPFENGKINLKRHSTLEIFPITNQSPYQLSISEDQILNLNIGDKIRSISGTTVICIKSKSNLKTFLLNPAYADKQDSKYRLELNINDEFNNKHMVNE
jgi:hypothetical protein